MALRGVRPGGLGNGLSGNPNFHGGPARGRPGGFPRTSQPGLTPQQIQYINAGTGQGSRSSQAPSTPSPYDASYFNSLNIANMNASDRIANLQRNIDQGRTNLQNSLAELKYNNAQANRNAQLAENARGGFAQGALGYQIGQINHQYQTREGDLSNKYAQDVQNWQAAINQVQQGLPLTTIALGLASAARQANLGLSA